MKKCIILVLVLLLVGCTVETKVIKKASANSKTYLFFKGFNKDNYYMELWDRNNSKNDGAKIIMSKKNNNYYYEFNNMVNIWKDDKNYVIDKINNTYYESDNKVSDYSFDILPSDIKTKGYETGEEKVYGSKYIYEKYTYENIVKTYYFKGNKLIYIKYKTNLKTLLYKFDYMKKSYDKLFNIGKYTEVTY